MPRATKSKAQRDYEAYQRVKAHLEEAKGPEDLRRAIKSLEDMRTLDQDSTGYVIWRDTMGLISLGWELAEEFNQDPKKRIEGLLIMEQFELEQKLQVIKALRAGMEADRQPQ